MNFSYISPILVLGVFFSVVVILGLRLPERFRLVKSIGWYFMLTIGVVSSFCMAILCVNFTSYFFKTDKLNISNIVGPISKNAIASEVNKDRYFFNIPVVTLAKKDEVRPDGIAEEFLHQRGYLSFDHFNMLGYTAREGLVISSKTKDENEVESKDAIGNAMAAVALAISAITLVVSMGTTWLAHKMKDLSDASVKMRELDRKAIEIEQFFSRVKIDVEKNDQKMRGQKLLRNASCELHDSLKENSTISLPHLYLQYQFSLSALMDESETVRKQAFGSLIQVLHPTDFVTHTEKFKYLQKYFEYCSQLHGTPSKWCLIFSQDERNAFAVAGRGNSSVDF